MLKYDLHLTQYISLYMAYSMLQRVSKTLDLMVFCNDYTACSDYS